MQEPGKRFLLNGCSLVLAALLPLVNVGWAVSRYSIPQAFSKAGDGAEIPYFAQGAILRGKGMLVVGGHARVQTSTKRSSPGQTPGQEPCAILPPARPVFRAFSGDSCLWPKALVSGQSGSFYASRSRDGCRTSTAVGAHRARRGSWQLPAWRDNSTASTAPGCAPAHRHAVATG